MSEQPERLGDAPIEEKYVNQMKTVALVLDELFNPETFAPHARGIDPAERKVGFVLLVFSYGDEEGRANYISNGADRRDIIALFREQIKRFEGQPEMKGHG
jgi:hypothetical protein